MKTIIAGSRTIGERSTKWLINQILKEKGMPITEVVSGTARGVDQGGELFASEHNISVKRMPADWEKIGKRAGYVRNAEMAEYADAAIILWDGHSRGTKHMIDLANKKGLKVTLFDLSK